MEKDKSMICKSIRYKKFINKINRRGPKAN
jgi:hypothetical protein